MAVADLQECQPRCVLRHRLLDKADRARDAARDRPQDPGTSPGHAFKNLAPADAFASLFRIMAVISHGSLLQAVDRSRGLDRPRRGFIPGVEKKFAMASELDASGRPKADRLLMAVRQIHSKPRRGSRNNSIRMRGSGSEPR